MVADQFIAEGHPITLVLSECDVPRSSYYYKPKESSRRKGKEKSRFTLREDGQLVSNEEVVEQITDLLSEEFVDYGYLKVTH